MAVVWRGRLGADLSAELDLTGATQLCVARLPATHPNCSPAWKRERRSKWKKLGRQYTERAKIDACLLTFLAKAKAGSSSLESRHFVLNSLVRIFIFSLLQAGLFHALMISWAAVITTQAQDQNQLLLHMTFMFLGLPALPAASMLGRLFNETPTRDSSLCRHLNGRSRRRD
jgi:hypothetical protein